MARVFMKKHNYKATLKRVHEFALLSTYKSSQVKVYSSRRQKSHVKRRRATGAGAGARGCGPHHPPVSRKSPARDKSSFGCVVQTRQFLFVFSFLRPWDTRIRELSETRLHSREQPSPLKLISGRARTLPFVFQCDKNSAYIFALGMRQSAPLELRALKL